MVHTYDGHTDKVVRNNGTFLSQLLCSCGQPIEMEDRVCLFCECKGCGVQHTNPKSVATETVAHSAKRSAQH